MKIAAEEKAKYDAKKLRQKTEEIREQERKKLESGGLIGMVTTEAKKFLKDATKGA